MEKAAKTRSRAKAAVPSAPIVTQPEPEPPAQAMVAATPVAKKVRKTKKKKQSPTAAAPVEIAATTIISTAPITTIEPLKSDETANQPAPKKRTKRLKAQEIVAEIEQQEKPEESAIVSLLEESTKPAETTPAKKTKKSVGRKGGRKKKEVVEEKPVESTKTPARRIPVVVEAPKTVQAPITTTPSAKKPAKKRGRKAAQAADRTQVVEPEQQQPEPQHPEPQSAIKVVTQDVAVVIATKTPKQAQETVQQAPLSRTRTRTKTQTRVEPVAKPALNTTQDLPSEKPVEQPAKPEAPVVVSEKAAEPTSIVEQQPVQTSKAQQAPSTPSEAPPSAKKPKVGGGARIVRPKETVALVKAIPVGDKEEKVEVEKKVVEIVKREAGPRIVKPPEALIQEQLLAEKKRKLLAEQGEPKGVKKLKDKTELPVATKKPTATESAAEHKSEQPAIKKDAPPDFKSIHQKETSKMESIIDFQKRLHQRHMTLNGADNNSNSSSKIASAIRGVGAAAITAASVRSPSAQSAIPRLPIKSMASATARETPKQAKIDPVAKMIKKPTTISGSNTTSTPKVATANVLATQSSNIPVFVNKQPKHDAKLDPKTPKQFSHVSRPKTNTVDNIENTKTPRARTVAPPMVTAPKTPANQPKNVSTANSDNLLRSANKNALATTTATSTITGVQGSIPPQLATSSFIRRKSFDLNASLSRRLGYKPYIGKLKPVETTVKPTPAISAALSTTKHNLNCTKN